MTIEKGSLAL